MNETLLQDMTRRLEQLKWIAVVDAFIWLIVFTAVMTAYIFTLVKIYKLLWLRFVTEKLPTHPTPQATRSPEQEFDEALGKYGRKP